MEEEDLAAAMVVVMGAAMEDMVAVMEVTATELDMDMVATDSVDMDLVVMEDSEEVGLEVDLAVDTVEDPVDGVGEAKEDMEVVDLAVADMAVVDMAEDTARKVTRKEVVDTEVVVMEATSVPLPRNTMTLSQFQNPTSHLNMSQTMLLIIQFTMMLTTKRSQVQTKCQQSSVPLF